MLRTSLTSLKNSQNSRPNNSSQVMKSPNSKQFSQKTTNQKPQISTSTQQQITNTKPQRTQIEQNYQEEINQYQKQSQQILQRTLKQQSSTQQQRPQSGVQQNQDQYQQNGYDRKPQQQQSIHSIQQQSMKSNQTMQRPQTSTRQKQVQQFQDNSMDETLYECPEGCGRKFNQVALQKHAKICKKVFQQKRKEFNSAKQRIVEEEQKKMVLPKGKTNVRPVTAKQQTQQNKKKSDWRQQSEAFRAIVKQGKGQQLSSQQSKIVSESLSANLTPCKFCGRKFNETAAAKHIPVCEKKSKENKIKAPAKQNVSTKTIIQNTTVPKQAQTKVLTNTTKNLRK